MSKTTMIIVKTLIYVFTITILNLFFTSSVVELHGATAGMISFFVVFIIVTLVYVLALRLLKNVKAAKTQV